MYSVITPVSTEPVSLAEAKTHMKVEEDAEDSLILDLISAAREYCESFTRRTIATQTLETYCDSFPHCDHIKLPMPPLRSVTSVKYTDSDGTETTLANTEYLVDTVNGRIVLPYGGSWPTATMNPVNPIKIRYVAGYTTLPAQIKQAMLLLIGHWYDNRELVGDVKGHTAFSVHALLSQFKAGWF
jgi:uncharacterized phiE125 gp8 family phage protein